VSQSVQHFDGSSAHGPVQVFLSNSGRLAFLCQVDNAAWELAAPLVREPMASKPEAPNGPGSAGSTRRHAATVSPNERDTSPSTLEALRAIWPEA